MKQAIKIAITGPESTGKTSLSEQLAKHFKAELVVEFARDYLIEKGQNYNYEDIIFMAEQQIQLENEAVLKDKQIIICDTDTINFKIWLEFYNFKVPQFILNHIESKPYQHSLLLYPNTKWENDGLRKNENDRLLLYNQFVNDLNHYNYAYTKISGLNEARLTQAIEVINHLK